MPTSNEFSAPQWRSWQPENLLEPEAEPEAFVPKLDSAQSDVQLKAELARLRQQAEQQGLSQGIAKGQEEGRKQGYDAGFLAGREAGEAQGKADAEAAQQATLRQAREWVSAFKLSLDNLDSLIPGRLVQLALAALQQLQGEEASSSSSRLLEQIKRLMKRDELLQGKARLMISPADSALVQEALGDTLRTMGWEIQADPQLSAGGCRIVSDEVEFDASLETRWQALCERASEGTSS
jgi:flagellar assembly protein FliH